MAKSAKAYQDEFYGAGKKALDTQKTEWAKQDASYIEEISGINNKAAQNTADKIQQQINQAPVASRALYDANALDEAISKKKLQESMANMGLTDSGLSSSMQTALALQKTRADAGVRRQEREYVQGLENAIADVWAQTEAANAKMAASRQQATVDRYNQGLTDLYSDSLTAGAEAYAAEVEAENEAIKQANELTIAGLKLTAEQQNKVATTIQNLMKEGYDYKTATILATQLHGGVNAVNDDGTTNQEAVKQNLWNANYIEAINRGLSEEDATVYADAGGGEFGEMALLEAEIRSTGVDVDTLTDFSWTLGDLNDTLTKYNYAVRGINSLLGLDTMSSKIKNEAKKTLVKAQKRGLSDAAAEYATAQAIGKWVADSGMVSQETAVEVYDTLCGLFSGTALTAAVDAAGLQAEEAKK